MDIIEHHFNIEIAKQVGVHAAVIYNNIQFWCAKNEANEKHFYDGRYWTYNSIKAYTELFPYLSPRQIEYALKKLVDNNLIVKGCYNKSPYDKTLWYSANDISIYEK